ncbi:MAG: TlyA family RNA methyltransferase [Roseitalea sp.]|jgi:23S rRNA (cytidine1920-2'-O)/16S rRNA (cytidine1409-2'-O)-methyltransferase|nr:TlyA family RNA methyltransferase [Roseitalea sp.]MBO6722019.1 TlyA family RNA methyltransferase [Roseitalea sp.]MBO6743457.1 TlyA family RNA methyltransferase [Roseitalea sp.]
MRAIDDTLRQRLDRTLVTRGLFATRARARDAIMRGTVTVDGQTVTKPAHLCTNQTEIAVADPASPYVSRAALKLKAALDAFPVPVTDAICLDIGASTGGFTQALLEAGAAKVHAIDVGHGQMDRALATDRRVHLTEGLNARDLKADHLAGDRPWVIVSDVSFISLKLALPAALDLAAPGAHLVALVKPQFEVGRDRVGKGGLVAVEDAEGAADGIATWLDARPGWSQKAVIPSPIAGGDGNAEFLLWGAKDG